MMHENKTTESAIAIKKKKLIKYAAFAGGGAKGTAHFGFIKELKELGLFDDIKMISGASAGAIMAFIAATGWDYQKMQDTFFAMDLEDLITTDSKWANWLSTKVSKKLGNLFERLVEPFITSHNAIHHFGIHKAFKLTEWFEDVIFELTGDRACTFEKWHQIVDAHPEKKMKDICLEATNLNTRYAQAFSYKTKGFEDVPIALALRASMAYPGFFTAVKIKDQMYVDGGIQRNCPGQVFEKESKPGIPHPKLVCSLLATEAEIKYFINGEPPVAKPVHNIMQYTSGIMEALLNGQLFDMLNSAYKEKSVIIDTKDAETLDFTMSKEKKLALIESGSFATINYLRKKFPEINIVERYGQETIDQAKKIAKPLKVSNGSKKASPALPSRETHSLPVFHQQAITHAYSQRQTHARQDHAHSDTTLTKKRARKEVVVETAANEPNPTVERIRIKRRS